MSQQFRNLDAWRRTAGVTLIELMVAMVLGLLVAAGIISVFVSTSRSNRVQAQMARLQENGRFAIDQLRQSLRMANANYCSSSGGGATAIPGGVYVDGLDGPTVMTSGFQVPDNATPFGTGSYPAAPTSTYSLPSYLYLIGFDCTTAGCQPFDPNSNATIVPAAGTAVGSRVIGSDILTLRYIDTNLGWTIAANDTMTENPDKTVNSFTITAEPNEPSLNTIQPGDLMMYGNCSNSYVFAASRAGNTITVGAVGPAANQNFRGLPAIKDPSTPRRLFDFAHAFKTVTWYLQVVDDDSSSGRTTGALMRRVNGQPAQEIVRGVERLDFRYGIMDSSGNTHYLTAQQINQQSTNTANFCLRQPSNAPGQLPNGNYAGCGWRAVKTIEVSMLVDGQNAINNLEAGALAYAYSPDSTTVAPPNDPSHVVNYATQGFQRGLLRREFQALVSVRNFNP